MSSVGDASLLTIAGGDEPPAVDITLLPGRAATIAGTALASNGEPYRGRLQIVGSERSGALAAPSLQTLARPDGTFEFPNVAPGDYVVQTIDRGAIGGEFAHQFVSVADRDIRGLSLHASAGSTVSGRITFEDSPTQPSTQSVRFMFLQKTDSRSRSAPRQLSRKDQRRLDIQVHRPVRAAAAAAGNST